MDPENSIYVNYIQIGTWIEEQLKMYVAVTSSFNANQR